MHLDAVEAAIDLRDAQIHQMRQPVLEPAIVEDLL